MIACPETPNRTKQSATATVPRTTAPFRAVTLSRGALSAGTISPAAVGLAIAVHLVLLLEPNTFRNRPALRFPRRQLEGRVRTTAARESPGPQVASDLQHRPLAIEEDRVDRKPHEERHDGRRGSQEQPLAAFQPAAAQQPAHPRQRAVC